MLTKEELEKLRRSLPKDKDSRIKKLFLKKHKKEVNHTAIWRALRGESKRIDILSIAVQVANDFKIELEILKNKL